MKIALRLAASLVLTMFAAIFDAPASATEPVLRLRSQEEVVYSLHPDRSKYGNESNDKCCLAGGRRQTDVDPTSKAFNHGSYHVGLTPLDYAICAAGERK
jgi:hypothetical protein